MAIRPGKYPQLADSDWLLDQYGAQGKSCPQIAAELGCSNGTVENRLHQFGIPVRGRHYEHWNDKACERCGKMFTPSGPAQKFCSKSCRYGTLICEKCGSEFPAVPDKTVKEVTYKRRFCSHECLSVWRAESCSYRWINRDGYVVVPNPTFSRRLNKHGYVELNAGVRGSAARKNNGRVLEHRWVMEQRIGPRLYSHEEVHHRNGHRDDNDRCPECPPGTLLPAVVDGRLRCASCGWSGPKPNLELWTKSQPRGQRVEDKIEWALEFLAQYGYRAPELV